MGATQWGREVGKAPDSRVMSEAGESSIDVERLVSRDAVRQRLARIWAETASLDARAGMWIARMEAEQCEQAEVERALREGGFKVRLAAAWARLRLPPED